MPAPNPADSTSAGFRRFRGCPMLLAPTPPPKPATFPVSDLVATRIRSAAAHRGMNAEQWVEYHFRVYFGLPR